MTPRALHLLSVIEVQQRHSGSATLASLSRALPNDPDTIREDLQALVEAGRIDGDLDDDLVTHYFVPNRT